MLTLTKKMSHVTLIGTFSYKGTQGQTAVEPVWAVKMGRHETLSCWSSRPSCGGTLSTVTLYQSMACS